MTNNELEPCYSCRYGCRVWHKPGYESVVCQCPNAGAGCDSCNEPGAIIYKCPEGKVEIVDLDGEPSDLDGYGVEE